jgi:hypothetical protein
MILASLGQNDAVACYRVISPAYAGTPLSGIGAARQGGRFNRPGQEALYLSMDEASALAEYKQDNPWLPPGTICTFFVRGLRVAVSTPNAGRLCGLISLWTGARNGSASPSNRRLGIWPTMRWRPNAMASCFPRRRVTVEPIWWSTAAPAGQPRNCASTIRPTC